MIPEQVYDEYRKGDPEQDMWPYSQFLRYIAQGNVLEIGVRGGVSTAALLCGVREHGGHVYSVDVNPNCADLYAGIPEWTFIHANSHSKETVLPLIPAQLDVLFIDGDHSAQGVAADLYGYYPLVKPEFGTILVHDIVPPFDPTPEMVAQGWPGEGLREVYHRFCHNNKLTHFELPGKFGLGVIYT